jgi:hypothetical protein
MSQDTVLAYWIEAGTGELRIEGMGNADIFRGGTYESEVRLKYARDPIEVVIIQMSRAGNDWERSEVNRLQAKAAELREARER